MDVSRTKICLDTFILESTNMNWRVYKILRKKYVGYTLI
jgi:hypothetical protein